MTINVGGKQIKRGEGEVAEEEKKEEENKINPSDYSCQILLEKTTLEKAKDRSLPRDGYLVWYNVEGKEMLDVTRSGKQSNIFDMYYDRYGKDVVQKIDYGCGTIRPNLWGLKATPPKKGKKRK